MANRADEINQIIAKRRPLGPEIEKVEGKLLELREQMGEVSGFLWYSRGSSAR